MYGLLAHGLLTGKLAPDWHFLANDWRSKCGVFQGTAYRKNLEIVSKLQTWAAQRGRSVAELAIAWTLAHPAVHVAIVGARNPQQIEQTAPAANWHLTPGELEEIDIIMRGAVPVGGPTPEGMLTIVGISADSRLVGGSGSRAGRRLIAVAAMFVGALVGSLLIFHVSIVSPLVIALIVIAIIAVTTGVLSRTNPIWVRANQPG